MDYKNMAMEQLYESYSRGDLESIIVSLTERRDSEKLRIAKEIRLGKRDPTLVTSTYVKACTEEIASLRKLYNSRK